MLEIKNICFERENRKILNNVSLTIDTDKFVAITGPNGSGKSTLAKIIMGIEKPDSGEIILDGENIASKSIDERAKMGSGFAFQQPVKFKGITVFDLIKLSADKEITKADACDILSKVGLCAKEYIDREVNGSLSGGELKRIEIATIAVRKTKLTIFDEPEAGIDLWSFNNLIQVFLSMRQAVKGSTLVISHQEKILNIADEIVLMNNGEIKQIGQDKSILKIDRPCCKLNDGGDCNG